MLFKTHFFAARLRRAATIKLLLLRPGPGRLNGLRKTRRNQGDQEKIRKISMELPILASGIGGATGNALMWRGGLYESAWYCQRGEPPTIR